MTKNPWVKVGLVLLGIFAGGLGFAWSYGLFDKSVHGLGRYQWNIRN